MVLSKRITTAEDLEVWKTSQTCADVLAFVQALALLVEGLANDAEVVVRLPVAQVMEVLRQAHALVDAHPVVVDKDTLRFGKVEFRDWYDDVAAAAPGWVQSLLGLSPAAAAEAAVYLGESFGNRTRIDYGSGHELNFVCFLMCLERLGTTTAADHAALVLRVFAAYMALMRRLQRLYWLEPAGLHGVWGLDDYHFLPFLFGAWQLRTHKHLKPKLIHNREMVEMFADKYMYFECIHFINSVKSGAALLRWHLPMLDDISAVRLWTKVSEGMVKMYSAEVLGKLPIVQHMMFGDTLPAPPGLPDRSSDAECGHVHAVNTWGDCCGIKVPSAVAAAASAKPLPFD